MKHRRHTRANGRRLRALTAAAALATASPALAGLVDSPVPNLKDQPASAVFYVTGVHGGPRYADFVTLETVFTCTSLEKSETLVVGLELFDADGTGPVNAYLAAQPLKAGQTISLGTDHVAGFQLGDYVGSEARFQGSARIISTSKKIVCSAHLTHGGPPEDPAFGNPWMQATCGLRVVRNDQNGD